MIIETVNCYALAVSGGGAGSSTVAAAKAFTTGTTTGNQSYTTAALGSTTPACAIVLGNRHEDANGSAEDRFFSLLVGLIDDGNREVAAGAYCLDNVTTGGTTGGAYGNNTNVVLSLNGGITSTVGNGLLVSGGLEINYSSASGVNTRAAYLALAGDDVVARVGTVALGTGTSAIDVTAPAFEPDFAIYIGDNGSMTSLTGETKHSFGIATKDGTQRCVALSEYRSAVSQPFMAMLTDSIAAEVNFQTGALTYKVAASDFDASGFSVTPSASAGSDVLGYLAVNLGGARAKLVDFSTPTSTGSFSITGAGFTPKAAIIVMTNLEVTDPSFPLTSAATMGGYSVTVIDEDGVIQSMSQRIRYNVSPQNTRCLFDAALLGPSDTACDALEATFTQWTSDGAQFSASAAQGTAKKGFILFVE